MTNDSEVNPKSSAVVNFILMLVCLSLIGLGGNLSYDLVDMRNNGVQARGIVVDHHEQIGSGSNNSNTYAPIVEFTDKDGRKNKFKDSVSSYPPKHKVGEEVEVLYMVDDPSDAIVDYGMTSWFLPLGFLGMGFLGFVLMMIQYMKNRKKRL